MFVVFFSGAQAKAKILKICEAFGANCYPVPEDMTKQRQITREVSRQFRWLIVRLSFKLTKISSLNCHYLTVFVFELSHAFFV